MVEYIEKQTIKNIITGENMQYGELEYDWQEFVLNRQENIEQKTDTSNSFKAVEKLLEQIDNNELAGSVRDAVINRECDVIYINYSRGFKEGLKVALMLGEL